MSVQRVKHETSATDFIKWIEYLRLEKEKVLETDKLDMYLAAIACEVRRSFVKTPATVKMSDFILDFSKKEQKPMTKEEATAASKRYWFSIAGSKGTQNG